MLASLTYFREPHAHRDYYRPDRDGDTIVSRTYDAHAPCRVCHTLISHTHGTSGRGVATDRGPVTNARIVAYALCSKNVVHVNEAKLPHGGSMHQGHFSSYELSLKPPFFYSYSSHNWSIIIIHRNRPLLFYINFFNRWITKKFKFWKF